MLDILKQMAAYPIFLQLITINFVLCFIQILIVLRKTELGRYSVKKGTSVITTLLIILVIFALLMAAMVILR